MKKIIITFFCLVFLFLSALIFFLSTKGYETDRFNNFISQEIKKKEPKLDLEVEKIKIKLDLKKMNLFLSTKNLILNYNNIVLPLKETKIYFDFSSILKTKPKINRAIIESKKLIVSDIKKIVSETKPSNIKSFVLNNVSKGEISAVIDVSLKKNLEISDYKINGKVKNSNIQITKKIKISDTGFNFIADKNLILINSISTDFREISISNGSIQINKKKDFLINGSLNTNFNLDNTKLKKSISEFIDYDFFENKIEISGNFLNEFTLSLSDSLELLDYNYKLTGSKIKSEIDLLKPFSSPLIKDDIKKIFLDKSNLKINLNKKQNNIIFDGIYKVNKKNEYEKYKITNKFHNLGSDFELDLDLREYLVFDILNYEKNLKKKANIKASINLINKKIKIENFNYKENKNLISINGVEISKNKIRKFKNVKIKTYNDGKQNNNFEIIFGKKIIINGETYDSTNLIKKIKEENKNDLSGNFSKDIQINLKSVITKLSLPLNNFSLVGRLENGKFTKISSKTEFSNDKYFDISLKKDFNSKKKIIEIYSDVSKPLLADFKFFKGIEGGNVMFSSTYDDVESSSNLIIENFKLRNAPAFAKLLTLADLGGVADLMSGDGKGISFDTLEIKFTKDSEVLRINELYAIGPSLSILMNGYVENKSGLTSLRGTMVPARTLNKIISKIPFIGDILIGKEVGEGVFGVSFKMKGKPEKIKTTVNPVKTLTPRFITKALEKQKKIKNKK